jgi:hypothetical protein
MQAMTDTIRSERSIDLTPWLEERGIRVVGSSANRPTIDRSNRLSLYMGDHIVALLPMLRIIKQRLNGRPHPVSLNLQHLPPAQIEHIIHFGLQAQRNGLFAYFRYEKRRHHVYLLVQDDPRVIGFVTGAWFERWVLERVLSRLSADGAGDEMNVLTNTNVKLPDGQDFEIDILVSTVDRVMWLECKSGNAFSSSLSRYRAIVEESFWLPPEQAGLVILDPLTSDEKTNLGLVSSMSVVNPTDLDKFLGRALARR